MPSRTTFKSLNLRSEIVERLVSNGFRDMTPVQAEVIPYALQRRDLIVQSQTGSGKTLAYLVPLAQHLKSQNAGVLQALIIVPTRELCMQIKETANMLGLNSEIFIGGTPIEEDSSRLSTTVCIATPGRLLELMIQNSKAFKNIQHLVLDESDKLLDFGFESKLLAIIGMLPSNNRVTGLFSATISEAVTKLSLHSLRSPVTVKVATGMPEKLKLLYLIASPNEKIDMLIELTKDRQSIVFFATCAEVEFFYALLNSYYSQNGKVNFVHKMHGRLNQNERNIIYGRFEEEGGILLCTDVAARGIDFKTIEFVLHFDAPKDVSNIIHRSGRTARNGNVGISVIFIMPNELAYIDYLKLKEIDLEEYKADKPESRHEILRSFITDDVLSTAVKAFVSYIRSYKEHVVNYVLNYKELDFDGLATLFFLRKIPGMPELKTVVFKNYPREPTTDKDRNTEKLKRKNTKKGCKRIKR